MFSFEMREKSCQLSKASLNKSKLRKQTHTKDNHIPKPNPSMPKMMAIRYLQSIDRMR